MTNNSFRSRGDLSDEPLSDRVGYGQGHGKIILMGEHAVVYDYPAIAIPFKSSQVEVYVSRSQKKQHYIYSDLYKGPLLTSPSHMINICHLVELSLQCIPHEGETLDIRVVSDIPAGRGMGSSAAVSVALVRALADFYEVQLPYYQLAMLVNQAEVIAHESTSGLDTLITSSDYPVVYRKSDQPRAFTLDLDAYLVLADSGREGRTKLAVSRVAQLKAYKPAYVKELMQTIGGFVDQAYRAIQAGDTEELGRLMTYNHYYLNQMEVSNEHLDRIINASWLEGALGAKLTGGGMGGCVIALARDQEHAKAIAGAMHTAGAQSTWTLDLKNFYHSH